MLSTVDHKLEKSSVSEQSTQSNDALMQQTVEAIVKCILEAKENIDIKNTTHLKTLLNNQFFNEQICQNVDLQDQLLLMLRIRLIALFNTQHQQNVLYSVLQYKKISYSLRSFAGPYGFNPGLVCPITKEFLDGGLLYHGVADGLFLTEQGYGFKMTALHHWVKETKNNNIPYIAKLSNSDKIKLKQRLKQHRSDWLPRLTVSVWSLGSIAASLPLILITTVISIFIPVPFWAFFVAFAVGLLISTVMAKRGASYFYNKHNHYMQDVASKQVAKMKSGALLGGPMMMQQANESTVAADKKEAKSLVSTATIISATTSASSSVVASASSSGVVVPMPARAPEAIAPALSASPTVVVSEPVVASTRATASSLEMSHDELMATTAVQPQIPLVEPISSATLAM